MDDDAFDATLMARLARGDTGVIGELYMRHGDQVLRFLTRTLRDGATAEDLCQDIFLGLPGAASRYRDERKLRSWLLGIAAKKARGWQRRQWVRDRLLRGFWSAEQPPTAGEREPSALDQMAAAFDQLPHELREVLVLQVGEGLSGVEIAEVLSLSHGAVRVRLHRARQRLRELVERVGTSAPTEP